MGCIGGLVLVGFEKYLFINPFINGELKFMIIHKIPRIAIPSITIIIVRVEKYFAFSFHFPL
jgi:hypothetical protein